MPRNNTRASSKAQTSKAPSVKRARRGAAREGAAREDVARRSATESVVVGIGASAGGLEALKAFFSAVPADVGLAFVVVVHLDPNHESSLPELLARHTSMRVMQALDRQVLEPNCVYIIPPNRHLMMEQGLIRVTEPVDRRALRGTIDHFFRSLAHDLRERAVCIILSGTGTEGALGATAVKAEGGLVMAQSPETAGQAGMPANAIATGLVDLVLPPGKMPEALLAYIQHPYLAARKKPVDDSKRPGEGLQSIMTLLRNRTKVDFRGYKKGTLQRRIERRMGLRQIKSFRRYAEYLNATPNETDLLFKDLLIGVTGFFRDALAFEELGARVLTKLIGHDGLEAPIRIWVPGCSTGEEAYSLAMQVAEHPALIEAPRRIQIFATDVDDGALEVARAGIYPESISLDVSPQRLHRFFTREDHRYRISKAIRESVVFASQNLISDPPFSKLDLVSCRNVLIYLEPEVQRKLISLFHFALNPGGFLFLGSSESTGEGDDLFTPVSKRWRIYSRFGPAKGPAVDIPFPKFRTDRPVREPGKETPEPTLTAIASQQLLAHFEPAAVVVNRNGLILHFSGPMHRYLNLPSGAPTLDLATLARDPLKPMLRAALHDSIRRRRRASLETSFPRGRNHGGQLRVTVAPIATSRDQDGLSLVIFEERPLLQKAVGTKTVRREQGDIVRKLEAELRMTKREQQGLVEQLESSNEELKAANEEVTSMNEELQSTNEELESSREELQSMNEELSTVNAQLQEKVHELTSINDDLTNLLAATDIATVFVDADLRVNRFTGAATRLLNLIPSDLGRPIGHMATNLVDFDLAHEVNRVLDSREAIEKAAEARDGRHYIIRVLPYQREGRGPRGVVVTLSDVTALKASQQELKLLNQTLEERIRDRSRRLSFPHDVARTVSEAPTWHEALRGVLRRICTSEKWQVGYVYLPSDQPGSDLVEAIEYLEGEQFARFHRPKPRRVRRGEGLAGRAFAEGRTVWFDDRASLMRALPASTDDIEKAGLQSGVAMPLLLGGKSVAIIELFSTSPNRSGDDLHSLLADVGSQVGVIIDHERTMNQAAALVWQEQQNLVHTLHDSVGQQLTALAMLSVGLGKKLKAEDPEIQEIVSHIGRVAQGSIEQIRQIARGLFPIEVDADADGLMHALTRLAETTTALGVKSTVEEDGHPQIRDNRIATELYRIAQEAVTNALKHANASRIVIRLAGEPGTTTLTITDDGNGMKTAQSDEHGVGFRIMRYRAQSVGAALSIDSKPERGTIVTCVFRDRPYAFGGGEGKPPVSK